MRELAAVAYGSDKKLAGIPYDQPWDAECVLV